MRFHTTALLVLIASLFQVVASNGSDWLQFRGPDGQGHSDAEGVPTEWSEQKNIRWKVAVPGAGWSSPVISGNQIWLTSSEQDGKSLHALCFDKTSGVLLYNVKVLTTDEAGPRHPQNGYASPTPVLDGDRVYVHFGPRGTACLHRDGEIVWRNTEFAYDAFQGAASSPIIHDDLLILTCDGTDHQFLVALDKKTGKIVWKQPRAHLENAAARHAEGSVMARIAKMAYSTPLIQNVDGSPQLISNVADHVAAYDLRTGKEIWWMPYVGFSQVARPSYGNELFYVVGSVAQDQFCVFAIRPGKGKLREDQLAWQCSKGIAHVPSPLLVGKELYVVDNSGVASCLDALTGEVLWRERLGGNYDASPIEVRGRIYYLSRDGKMTVLAAGRSYQVLATNQLEGTFKASPAVSGKALFLRSEADLYRIE
ncbi:MAG: PQQ-like beta-propeller repeat protein [Planctomycetes bacterium]|nr:PQQ-like beta-propeller repeat protein [Planctomycetota bacterium]